MTVASEGAAAGGGLLVGIAGGEGETADHLVLVPQPGTDLDGQGEQTAAVLAGVSSSRSKRCSVPIDRATGSAMTGRMSVPSARSWSVRPTAQPGRLEFSDREDIPLAYVCTQPVR